VDSDIIFDEGYGIEALVKVDKEIGDGILILNFGEGHLFAESIVEAVDIDEVDRVGLLVNKCEFENAYG
jgi:hypothetical protein